jgi:hypothetical protein
MSKPPIASPHTEGRVYGTDWSIVHVATLLRSDAGRGAWRLQATAGSSTSKANQNYLRTVSALHLPTNLSLIFMRLDDQRHWYASLCFASSDGHLPWNADVAERWLCALFGQERPEVFDETGTGSEEARSLGARQFTRTTV